MGWLPIVTKPIARFAHAFLPRSQHAWGSACTILAAVSEGVKGFRMAWVLGRGLTITAILVGGNLFAMDRAAVAQTLARETRSEAADGLSFLHRLPGQLVVPLEDLPETVDDTLSLPREHRWRRDLKALLHAPGWLDLGVSYRPRFMSFDHAWRRGEFGTDSQLEQQTRFRLQVDAERLSVRLPFRLLFEFQDARASGAGPGNFVTSSQVDETDISQLLVQTTAGNLFDSGLRGDLHVGRMNLDIGRRDLVGKQFFGNVPFNFDGAHLSLARHHAWRLRLFLVRPVEHKKTVLDPWFFDREQILFWGVHTAVETGSRLETEVFYFGLNDKTGAVNGQRTINTFGLRLFGKPSEGKLDCDAQTVYQTGSRGGKDLFAYYQHAEFGYTVPVTWTPRLTGVFDYFSGTPNPDGSTSGTFDGLFGPRHFDITPTGIFGPFFRSNLMSPGWRFVSKPSERILVQLWFRQWYLAQKRDAFVGSGLQDPTGGAGSNLGQTLDLRFWWNVGESNYYIEAGYLHWFKGSYFERLPASAGLPDGGEKDTDLFYVSNTIRL